MLTVPVSDCKTYASRPETANGASRKSFKDGNVRSAALTAALTTVAMTTTTTIFDSDENFQTRNRDRCVAMDLTKNLNYPRDFSAV